MRSRGLGLAAIAGLSILPALGLGQSFDTPPPNGLLGVGAAPVPDGDRFRDPDIWIDRFGARLSIFSQTGRGWQSQATTEPRTPGSEALFVANPVLYTHLTQRGGIQHDVYLPIDVLTSASTDALGAVSSASRDNESFTLDVTTTVDDGTDRRLLLRYGGHVEEELKSVNLGAGTSLDFADDNATLLLTLDGIVDIFDPVQWNGVDLGLTQRLTLSVNGSFSQVLSESTTLTLAWGLTGQLGHLHTPWNSVPREEGGRIGDYFPNARLRQAASVRVAQAIPDTRTFLQGGYRFYADDFGVTAHSADLTATQYVSDDVWLRAQYRYHSQGAPYFFTTSFPQTAWNREPRTADSDLAALDLHEVSGSLRWFYDRHGQPSASSGWIELGYTYYRRSNSLEIHMGTIGFCTAVW